MVHGLCLECEEDRKFVQSRTTRFSEIWSDLLDKE